MFKALNLFIWFFKYTFFYFNDGYDLHRDIVANFSGNENSQGEFSLYIPEEELEERKQILRDTPGPAGIKYACFVGNRLAGIPGAVCAVCGVILPIFAFAAVFLLITVFLEPAPGVGKWVTYMFNGMSAAAVGLIIAQMIKAVSHNKPNRRTITFLAPFAAFYLFAPDAMKNSDYYNIVFFLVIAVCSVVFAVAHIKISKAVEKRKNDPNYFYDPYSKKAVRERDRKIREEEEEMKRENKEKKEQRDKNLREAEESMKKDRRKWEE